MISQYVNLKEINSGKHRFEGNYYLNKNAILVRTLKRTSIDCTELGKIANVFNPGIFKRMFCVKSSKSVQYFQSSDVPSVLENSPVFVSKTQAKQLNLLVEPYDILVTGFGTIGNIRLVSKHQKDVCFANNVCRIRVNDKKHIGLVFSILSSKYGRSQLEKNASGSVVRYIEAPGIKKTLIPLFSDEFQEEINNLIMSALQLREEATDSLKEAENVLKKRTGLNDLSNEDYDYYGPSDNSREVSCFVRNIKDIIAVR